VLPDNTKKTRYETAIVGARAVGKCIARNQCERVTRTSMASRIADRDSEPSQGLLGFAPPIERHLANTTPVHENPLEWNRSEIKNGLERVQ